MLRSILVASDLSCRSKPAVARAVQIAEGYLCSQIAGFDLSSKTEVVVTSGHAFHVICEQAQDCKADMIVLGAYRRQFLRDVFTGTTIERVTRIAGRPVLMANSKTGERWRKVFIATDMSKASGHAARTAHALGLRDNAEVTFVYGYAPITRQMMTHAGIPVDRVHEEAEREFQSTRRDLGCFIHGLDLGDLNYNARIIEGVGADAIAGLVEQAKPDLLVIGTRGLSGVKRLFLGSVAQDLMGSLEIDVLAVPPQA